VRYLVLTEEAAAAYAAQCSALREPYKSVVRFDGAARRRPQPACWQT